MRDVRSFVVTMLAMFMLFILAFFKDFDIEYAFSSVVIAYVLGRTVSKASHVWAASKDEKADTRAVIETVDKGD